jgi:hypothetical protein
MPESFPILLSLLNTEHLCHLKGGKTINVDTKVKNFSTIILLVLSYGIRSNAKKQG